MSIGSDQFGGEADEEVEVFIDVSTLGSVFSHHGSSFFLRIGALRKHDSYDLMTFLYRLGHM